MNIIVTPSVRPSCGNRNKTVFAVKLPVPYFVSWVNVCLPVTWQHLTVLAVFVLLVWNRQQTLQQQRGRYARQFNRGKSFTVINRTSLCAHRRFYLSASRETFIVRYDEKMSPIQEHCIIFKIEPREHISARAHVFSSSSSVSFSS